MINVEIFSNREKEVIKLLLQGKSNKQIALVLGVSQSTVEYHLKNIYKKLQVSSRTEAVLQLGKSIGDNVVSELGKSTVEMNEQPANNGKASISPRRFLMKNLYYLLGVVLLLGVLALILFLPIGQASSSIIATIPASTKTQPLNENTSISPTLLMPEGTATVSAIAEIDTRTPDENTSTPSASITQAGLSTNEKFLLIKGLDYYLSTLDDTDSKLIFSAKKLGHQVMAGLSPDQTQFAYFTDNFIYLQNIPEQKTRKVNQEILGGDMPGGALKWSPDGKKLFTSCANAQQPSIAVCAIDISNGRVEALVNEKNTDELCHQSTDAFIEFRDLSRDGNQIVYSCTIIKEQGFRAPYAVYIYDIRSKTSTKVLDSESQTVVWSLLNILLAPDGNSLLMNGGTPNHQINIYLLDLRTKALTQLTNDSNFSFQATAWSNDSQSFYLHQTLGIEPYVEKNFLMDINGTLTPLVDVQGVITQ